MAERHPEFNRGWWWGWSLGTGPWIAIALLDAIVGYERAEAAGRWLRQMIGIW